MFLITVLLHRGEANLTNVGKLLEEHGKEFLGSKYVDPISSFASFQEFSVSNPEVRNHAESLIMIHRRKLFLLTSLVFLGLLENFIWKNEYKFLESS